VDTGLNFSRFVPGEKMLTQSKKFMKGDAMPKGNGKLRAETQRWADQILADYDLASHFRRLLQLAAEAWDASREARDAVQRDGAYQRSSRGALVPHPGLKAERDAVRSFAELVKAFDLGVEPPDPAALAVLHRRKR
jgi:hypothetical protein